MYILKMEYLEKRGAAQDALFAGGFPGRKYILMTALGTMVELVDITEATWLGRSGCVLIIWNSGRVLERIQMVGSPR